MDLEEIDFVWPRCVLRHLHKIIHLSDYIATCTHTHNTQTRGRPHAGFISIPMASAAGSTRP